MLLEFDKTMCNKIVCCTVDWISKFPDECEVLIARTTALNGVQMDITNNNNKKLNNFKANTIQMIKMDISKNN